MFLFQDHYPLTLTAQLLSESDLNPQQIEFIHLMYENGVAQSAISNIMAHVVPNGQLLSKTIKNITTKVQCAMDAMSNIDPSMYAATKTSIRLNE